MTFAELIASVREDDLDDVTDGCGPASAHYRWSDAFLLRVADEAQREACRRGACTLIADTLSLRLTAGVISYPLIPEILRLERVTWTSQAGDVLLEKAHVAALDTNENPQWIRQAAGSPIRYYVIGRTLYLDRAPTVDDVAQDATLSLNVWREPLDDPGLNEEMEIPAWHQQQLSHWIAYRALSRPDEDEQHQKLAERHLMLFDRHFGKPVEAGTLEYQLSSVGNWQPLAAQAYAYNVRRAASNWVRELG